MKPADLDAITKLRRLCDELGDFLDDRYITDPLDLRDTIRGALAAFDASRVGDPDLDATDGAHPAWWRGHDHVARQFAERVATLTQERDEARAERRAARLDRDAAEERVAELQRLVGGAR